MNRLQDWNVEYSLHTFIFRDTQQQYQYQSVVGNRTGCSIQFTHTCLHGVAEINVLILIIQESIYYTYFCKRKINVMTIVDHYGDIARQLSLKISQNNHSQCKLLEIINSDSYSHFNIAFLLYNYCIIKVYLFEFNKLIQQFWICSNSYKFLN